MKSCIFFWLFLLMLTNANSQETKYYTTTDKDGNRITNFQVPNRPVSIKITKDKEGKYTYERTCSGEGWSYKEVIKFDENKKIVSVTESRYTNDRGTLTLQLETESKRQPDGSLKTTSTYTPGRNNTVEEMKKMEAEYQKLFDDIEKDNPQPVSFNFPACELGNTPGCQPAFTLYAGPSVLFADLGSDRQTFFGGQIVANYNITKHIGIGINAGVYSKKIGTLSRTRSLIMIDGQYTFGKPENCDRKWIGEVHVLIGYAHEKYGSSKGNGVTYGGGLGVVYRISDKINIKAMADVIGTSWEDADETPIDYRTSVGLEFNFGRKRTGLTKSPNLTQKNY